MRQYGMEWRDRIQAWWHGADLSIFHAFHYPPYGGGNQFLLALRREARRQGWTVETNHLSRTTGACLYNSFNFDLPRLTRQCHKRCITVHRVDGPIAAYRGGDDHADHDVWIRNQWADHTVFQSQYSLQAHQARGLMFRHPVIIPNAVDPDIFYPASLTPRGEKLRLISTSWSSNPNKGAATYHWLDEHLDWDRYTYTFVGNLPGTFQHIQVQPPVPSHQLAALLRTHDIYLTASLHDPCSNALLEALACGLPAIYANSGGHAELVKAAGLGFTSPEEIPAHLVTLERDYMHYRRAIHCPSLVEVTTRYLNLFRPAYPLSRKPCAAPATVI